jgi:hypothetical protein
MLGPMSISEKSLRRNSESEGARLGRRVFAAAPCIRSAAVRTGQNVEGEMTTTEHSDRQPLCWTCYEYHQRRRVATRGPGGSLGPVWCAECFFAITDRRCLADAATDERPPGATLQ